MGKAWILEWVCLGRIFLAGVCGGILGYERQSKKKRAGLRTHVIVAISSALMVVLSKYGFQDVLGESVKVDPSRVAAAVVTAIGFLGSGMIIFRHNNVSGLTTSAGIWATVGVGLAVGAGMYVVGVCTALMVLMVEMFLGRKTILPRKKKADKKNIMIEYRHEPKSGLLEEIRESLLAEGWRICSIRTKKGDGGMVKVQVLVKVEVGWDSAGFVEQMIARDQVLQVREWV
ncbi:MAG: MgtC/SapB family protein [Lachnospiraceae bacterium]|nr:MgtC/SapB family protein [Lachnospiraceae bacterium]MCI9184665.1 MgtC/SapB family protein [Lachnospiraceae bacterium]